MFLIRFSLANLIKNFGKHSAIYLLFTVIVASLFSVLLATNSIQNEIDKTLESTADLVILDHIGGRATTINNDYLDPYEKILGISYVAPRVWGYYEVEALNKKFLIYGINLLDYESSTQIDLIVKKYGVNKLLNEPVAIVGSGVKRLLAENHLSNKVPFIKPNGEFFELDIIGTFDNETALETNDIVLTSVYNAREILGYSDNESTDIVAFVPNKDEAPLIATKIRDISPSVRVYQKKDIVSHYQNLFDKKSALFISLFFTTIFSFAILVFYKASALTAHEKKEIGILRAVGWSINSVILWKLIESSFVAIAGFLSGFIVSYIYLYIFNAPLLLEILLGSENLAHGYKLAPLLPFETIATVFLLLVPIYTVATIFPAWRAAVIDTHEALR